MLHWKVKFACVIAVAAAVAALAGLGGRGVGLDSGLDLLGLYW